MENKCHYIRGRWLEGEGKCFTSFDPATKSPLWEGTEATLDEVDQAVGAGREALLGWSALPLEKRCDYLTRFEKKLSDAKDSLALTISQETGKPLWESKTEVQAMVGKIAISINAYHERCRSIAKNLGPNTLQTTHRPHGVCAVFGPFNFPGHLPNGHIVPALLAGNTVVFKCSQLTPSVGKALTQLWEEAGLPPGVLNLVQGGNETGKALVSHRGIDALFFTGSHKVGSEVQKEFLKTPGKILALEMGGNNPLVVDDPGDLETAAYFTLLSAYITAGQRCSCARRLIVVRNKKGEAFLNVLLSMIRLVAVGPYTETPEPFLGPVITQTACDNLLQTEKKLRSKGGKICIPLQAESQFLTPGLIDVTAIEKREDIECFGPLLQLIKVPSFDAAIEEANNTDYGLSAGFLGQSEEKWERFFRTVKAGVINWNVPLTGASSEAPFGGLGKSGNFRPSAYYAADYCAYPVASVQNTSLQLPSKLSPGTQILARS